VPSYDDEQEPAFKCSHCRRDLFQLEVELGRIACFPCENNARTRLRELPGQYDSLGELLVPGRATGGSAKVTGSKDAPIPAAMQPLSLRANGGIVTLLQVIEDSWRPHLKKTIATFAGGPEQTLATVINFLSINLNWACRKYEYIDDDLDTIDTLYWQAKNIIEGNIPRPIPVHCRYLYDDGTECEAPMRVDINRESAKCGTCGTRWGRQEWVALYEATRAIAA
jgi:hypothetical protein